MHQQIPLKEANSGISRIPSLLPLAPSARRNLVTVNAAISACEKAGQWRKVLRLLEELPGGNSSVGPEGGG